MAKWLCETCIKTRTLSHRAPCMDCTGYKKADA
jgi:hypothetical protein